MEEQLGTAMIFVVCTALLSYALAKHLRVCYLIEKFDGPPSFPLLGNTHRMESDPREALVQGGLLADEFRERTGGLVRVWFGSVPTLIIYGAKYMEVILSSSRHLSKGTLYRFLEPWLGTGLLTSTGEKWFHRRKLLTPTFHFSILQNFMGVFNEQSIIFANKLEELADKGAPVNIYPLVTACVLDVICDSAMGKHINAQGKRDNEYVKAVKTLGDTIIQRAISIWLWPDATFRLSSLGKNQAKSLETVHGVTNKMIQERLCDPPRGLSSGVTNDSANDVGGSRKRIAFLDLLLEMHRKDKSFTLEDIREEVDTFMFEGHDTTAAAVSWAILLIGLHPEVQERLHVEIDEIFGNSDRPVTSEDLSRLTYLNRVVKESIRLIPSVPAVFRSLGEDIILDGKIVPKETMLLLDIYQLHRDPKYFPDPLKFDPDRFLPENVENRHPFAYAPFSAGPRNCIGQKFALMEDKVILVTLLRRFTIESAQSVDEAKPAGNLVIRPAEGRILVNFTRRN